MKKLSWLIYLVIAIMYIQPSFGQTNQAPEPLNFACMIPSKFSLASFGDDRPWPWSVPHDLTSVKEEGLEGVWKTTDGNCGMYFDIRESFVHVPGKFRSIQVRKIYLATIVDAMSCQAYAEGKGFVESKKSAVLVFSEIDRTHIRAPNSVMKFSRVQITGVDPNVDLKTSREAFVDIKRFSETTSVSATFMDSNGNAAANYIIKRIPPAELSSKECVLPEKK